jgi:hypothetical protein
MSQKTLLRLIPSLQQIGRFLRLWVAATVAQLVAGSSLSVRTALVAAAVGLVEVLYRLRVPTFAVGEVNFLIDLAWRKGHQKGVSTVAQAPVAINAADEPPLVNGQPQP